MLVRSAKLSNALLSPTQLFWQCRPYAQSIPVDKECLQYTLGIVELPIQEGPELDLMFRMGLPASDLSFQDATSEGLNMKCMQITSSLQQERPAAVQNLLDSRI